MREETHCYPLIHYKVSFIYTPSYGHINTCPLYTSCGALTGMRNVSKVDSHICYIKSVKFEFDNGTMVNIVNNSPSAMI